MSSHDQTHKIPTVILKHDFIVEQPQVPAKRSLLSETIEIEIMTKKFP